jgi:hypothetical protein
MGRDPCGIGVGCGVGSCGGRGSVIQVVLFYYKGYNRVHILDRK